MAEDKTFYVGQKAFIEREGKLLILIDPRMGVDLPGGKIQIGETDFDESLKREVREETALEIEIGKPFIRWYYEFKPSHRNFGKQVFLVGFKCRLISGDLILSSEHVRFEWVDKGTYEKFDDGGVHFSAIRNYFLNE